jgi:hypothetical protein
MEFHIYREGSYDRIVKDATKESLLYYIRAPRKWFSTPPKEVYRGDPSSAPQIAIISKQGNWCPDYRVAIPGTEDVVLKYPSAFSTKSKFMVGGKEFAWSADKELIEVNTDKVLARFARTGFAVKKKGVLSIYGAGVEMVDIVVVTGIAMQYSWEQSREQRRRAGALPPG